MKTCLFLISLDSLFKSGKMSLFDAVDFAADCGFGAVEPYPVLELEKPDAAFAEKLKRYCDAKGLAIPCFSMGVRLETPEYADSVSRLKRYAEMAGRLDSGFLHHTLAPTLQRDAIAMPDAEAILPQIAGACRDVAAYAKGLGVECLYEEQGYVFNGISDFGKLLSAIRGGSIVLDTGNILFADEPIAPFAGRYANRAAHVHVKDYIVKSGNGQYPGRDWYLSRGGNYIRGTVIGHGVADFVQTFRVLMLAGYDGYYSLEFDGPEDPLYAAAAGLENMRYYFDQAKQQMDIFKAKDLV